MSFLSFYQNYIISQIVERIKISPICLDIVSRDPLVSMTLVRRMVDDGLKHMLSWSAITKKPGLSYQFIYSNLDLDWDWCHLSRTTPMEMIIRDKHLPWCSDCASSVCTLHDALNFELLDLDMLSEQVFFLDAIRYAHLPWNWSAITFNTPFKFIINNPDFRGTFSMCHLELI